MPEGATAEDNVCVKTGGEMPALDATAEPHWELAKDYDLIDFELGVKISGAGFPVYKGYGARLQRALINFFLDNAREAVTSKYSLPMSSMKTLATARVSSPTRSRCTTLRRTTSISSPRLRCL